MLCTFVSLTEVDPKRIDITMFKLSLTRVFKQGGKESSTIQRGNQPGSGTGQPSC